MQLRYEVLPTRNELKKATLESLKILGGKATTKEINLKVAELLNLSEEILMMEDESGIGTAYEYRMRWVRTELKGKIKNISKGKWMLNDE